MLPENEIMLANVLQNTSDEVKLYSNIASLALGKPNLQAEALESLCRLLGELSKALQILSRGFKGTVTGEESLWLQTRTEAVKKMKI